VLGSCHRANMRATVTPTPSKWRRAPVG
jgi:hypothetical protein